MGVTILLSFRGIQVVTEPSPNFNDFVIRFRGDYLVY